MKVDPKHSAGRLFVFVVSTATLVVPCRQTFAFQDDVPTPLPVLTDDGCQTACGPITCFVAARSLGVDVSLGTMIEKCGWKEGQLTTLQRMQDTLASFENEIDSLPVRVTPEELQKYLLTGGYVAVLPVRKRSEEVNHAICAVGFEGDEIITIDYPELRQRYTLDELAEIWDGPVLLVSRSSQSWLVRNLPWLVLPALATLLFADLVLRRWQFAPRSGEAVPAAGRRRFLTLIFGVVPFALLQLSGCEREGSPDRPLTDENPQLGGSSTRKDDDATTSSRSAVILRHDFGVVKQGEIVEHEFRIKNAEDKEAEYLQYKLSCKCLSLADDSPVIPANGEGTIAVKLDTEGLQGHVKRYADLRSDDVHVRPVMLTLTGTVAGVEASPSMIDFGDLKTGAPASRTFYLIAAGYADAKVTSATTLDGGLQVTVKDVAPKAGNLDNGKRAFCRVKVEWNGEGLPPGAFDTRIAVTTNVPEVSSIDVPVVGYVRGAVELSPARAFFGNIAAGTQAQLSCKLIDGQLSWEEMKSLNLKADHDVVQGAFSRETASETNQIRLVVNLDVPSGAKKGLIKGDLVVSRKNGEFFFCIPYVALIK